MLAPLAGPHCPAPLRVLECRFAELRAVVGEPPDRHLLGLGLLNRDNHVPEERKRVVKIVLGRTRRVIGM